MREMVRVLFAVALQEEVIKVVEVVMCPYISEVCGRAYGIDL